MWVGGLGCRACAWRSTAGRASRGSHGSGMGRRARSCACALFCVQQAAHVSLSPGATPLLPATEPARHAAPLRFTVQASTSNAASLRFTMQASTSNATTARIPPVLEDTSWAPHWVACAC